MLSLFAINMKRMGKKMRKLFSMITFATAAALLFAGCIGVQQGVPDNLFPELKKGTSAAVSYIPEAGTGDITALGNLWRDRIEKILADRGIVVKARKDIVTLIDDMETFGSQDAENRAWKEAGADIVVLGNYSILEGSDGKPRIRMVAKAYRTDGFQLVSGAEFVEPLGPSWQRLASAVLGNIYQEKLEVVSSENSRTAKPKLKASLGKNPACYRAGDAVHIDIQTDPGTYVYIFNLTADNNVTLLYPNRWLPDKPVSSGRMIFPPAKSNVTGLVVYPLEGEQTSRESFKIVSSRQKLDFSFLPVPENQVFAGANKRDIDRITRILKKNVHYNQQVLTYYVGKSCR